MKNLSGIEVKTIDINAREWFDKVNGNSYFSAQVVVNYGYESEKIFILPFQYGYESQYIYSSFEKLRNEGILPMFKNAPSIFCRENGIAFNYSKQENCLKKNMYKVN